MASPPPPPPLTEPLPHTSAEDVYALSLGCILVVLGLSFLRAAGLATGGIAGIALLVSYAVPLPVGVLFMLLNLPFFVFAQRAMGADPHDRGDRQARRACRHPA